MGRFDTDDFGLESDDDEALDDLEESVIEREHDRYTITLTITVKASDADTAEDNISDFIMEAVDRLGKRYKSEMKILDYCLESIEPTEIS